jgi:putative DNA primase/helicase
MEAPKQPAKIFKFDRGKKIKPEKVGKSAQEQVQDLMPDDEYDQIVDDEFKVTLGDVNEALDNGELGISNIYIKMYRNLFCYNTSEKSWFKFNGITWELDEQKETTDGFRYLYHMLQNVMEKWMSGLTKATWKYYMANVTGIQNHGKMEKILNQAREGKDSLNVKGSSFDNDLRHLGAENGVIDLHNGKLINSDPKLYISKKVGCEYKEDASVPKMFMGFLNKVFEFPIDQKKSELSDDAFYNHCKVECENLIKFLQRLFGYILLGNCAEHKFVVFYGPQGRNGKGALSTILLKVFGDYGGVIPAEQLTLSSFNKDTSGPSEDVMYLKGKRLVIASETKPGAAFDTSFIKNSTGGDLLSGRHNHGRQCTFKPTHNTCLQTNFMPNSQSEDNAFFSRLLIIPFLREFNENPDPNNIYHAKLDINIGEELIGEMPGILKWIVDGAILYQRDGLKIPRHILNLVNDVKEDKDIFQDFIDEFCIVEAGKKERTMPFHKAFNKYLKNNGYSKSISPKTIADRVERKGFFKKKQSGNWHYIGLRLNEDGLKFLDYEDSHFISNDHYEDPAAKHFAETMKNADDAQNL